MNIDPLNQNRAAGAYGPRAARTGETTNADRGANRADGSANAGRADGVEVSEQARSVQRAEAAVRSAPDVREELVADLRSHVQDGSYEPKDEQVARRLIRGES